LGIEPNFENYTGDDLIETPGCGRGGSAGGRGGLGYGGERRQRDGKQQLCDQASIHWIEFSELIAGTGHL
jgi:hypothetical protein